MPNVVYHLKNKAPIAKTKTQDTIVKTFKKVDKVVTIDKEKDIHKIVKSHIVKSEIDTHALAQSFKDEAGIQAVFKKAVITGSLDENILNTQTGDNLTDITNMPTNRSEAHKLANSSDSILKSIDPALRGNSKTADEFLSSLSQEKIDSYIKTKIDSLVKKEVSVNE